jgi:hypothetical protein
MGNGYARGLAVGDFDNDSFDDILAFRPSGPGTRSRRSSRTTAATVSRAPGRPW